MIVVLRIIHTVIDYRTVKKGGDYTKKIIRNSLLNGIFLGVYSAIVMYYELRITFIQSLFVIIASIFGYGTTASIYLTRKVFGRKESRYSMKLRNGEHIVYKNKVNEGYYSFEKGFVIRSYDATSLNEGYIEKYPGIFIKYIDSNEVLSYFRIQNFGKYKGYPFHVFQDREKESYCYIDWDFKQNDPIIEELGLKLETGEKDGTGKYSKRVLINELSDLYEEWSSVRGYEVIDVEDPSTKQIPSIIRKY
jgi:phage shock protein PspC (stress-responsive transcriptional regulator)